MSYGFRSELTRILGLLAAEIVLDPSEDEHGLDANHRSRHSLGSLQLCPSRRSIQVWSAMLACVPRNGFFETRLGALLGKRIFNDSERPRNGDSGQGEVLGHLIS